MTTTKNKLIKMSIEEWEEKYRPSINPLSEDEYSADRFETYGEELALVLATPKRYIWTLVDGDTATIIIPGYHLVNRINYFITEFPWEHENIEVKYCDEEDETKDEVTEITEEQAESIVKHLNQVILDGSGYMLDFNCTSENWENEEDEEDPLNGEPMYEVYFCRNNDEEEQIAASGRYCSFNEILSDVEEILVEHGLLKKDYILKLVQSLLADANTSH